MASTPFTPCRQVLRITDANEQQHEYPMTSSPLKRDLQRIHPATSAYTTSHHQASHHQALLDSDDTVGLIPIGADAVDVDDCYHTFRITSHRSIALLFGRARNETTDVSTSRSITEQEMRTIGSTPMKRISLPNTAKHVSRDHAIIFYTPFGATWAVKILGQNGLIVNGRRRRAGLILRLIQEESTLDFFGVRCLFAGDGRPIEKAIPRSRIADASQILLQNGQSPTKKRPHPTSFMATGAASEKVQVPVIRRQVGNPLKRPVGAPPSPPTSSPVPFERAGQRTALPSGPMSSSPLRPASFEQHRTTYASDNEDVDDASGDDNGSPSLQRRAAKHDDSGIAFHHDEENSADEASQAVLACASKKGDVAIPVEEADEEEEDDASSTPSPVDRRVVKKIKLTHAASEKVTAQPKLVEIPRIALARPSSASFQSQPTFHRVQAHLRDLVAQLAQTYDLQGLLAGIIVFHRTATISATEAVRSVLASTPGLLRGEVGPEGTPIKGTARGVMLPGWSWEDISADLVLTDGDDLLDKEKLDVWQKKAWREKLEECLMEGECFGIISRAGKDASGNPLECWYYYDKEHDPDVDRAANLGALAKPMRAALKVHKPIFWKKAAYGHASDASGRAEDPVGLTSESQWGSSGSALYPLTNASIKKGDEENRADALKMPPPTKTCPSASTTSSSWEETQYEEREITWDREGDIDFEVPSKKASRRRR